MTDHKKAINLLEANAFTQSATVLENASRLEEALRNTITLWQRSELRARRLQREVNLYKPLNLGRPRGGEPS